MSDHVESFEFSNSNEKVLVDLYKKLGGGKKVNEILENHKEHYAHIEFNTFGDFLLLLIANYQELTELEKEENEYNHVSVIGYEYKDVEDCYVKYDRQTLSCTLKMERLSRNDLVEMLDNKLNKVIK